MMDRKTAIFMGMGVECIGVVMAFIWIGRYFDENYGWKGLGVAGGAVVGLIGWVAHVLIVVRVLAKQDKAGHTDPK